MTARLALPLQRIEARFALDAANKESRTVPVTWYTGATVQQFSWEKGLHNLTLVMDPDKVDMGRLESGAAPLTRGHSSPDSPDSVIGKVVKASLNVKAGTALVRFSKRADVEPLYQDVLDGILSNVSMEAVIHKMKEVTKKGESIRSFVATRWEPTAIALVAQGADPGARINAAAEVQRECEVEFAEVRATALMENTMADTTVEKTGEMARTEEVKVATAVPVADEQLNAAHKVGVTAEQGRITGILSVAKVCGCEMSFALKAIADNIPLDTFRKQAIDDQALRASRPEHRHVHVDILNDEADVRRRNMTGALLERFSPGQWTYEDKSAQFKFHRAGGHRMYDGARNYASCTLLDIAKECLSNMNIRWQTKSRTEIAQLAFQGTSDFPYILADVAGKSLRAGYELVESQWKLIAARRTAADFKTQKELTLDNSSRLAAVPESGEFTRGTLVESKETWKLTTYGKVIAITRQAIINDDLGAFTRTPQLLGQEVAMLEADTVYGIVTANAAMVDTFTLFSADHVNLATVAAVISVANLSIMRNMLMVQTSKGGKMIGIQPRYLVAPAALSMVAEQYCSANYVAATAANINPMAGRLTPVIEPRLDGTSATAWYLFGDPNAPNSTVLIYAYLEGQEGPYTETRNGFDVDGVEIKIRHDFGAGAVDFRGAVKNAGA